jgi:hypothetical protein
MMAARGRATRARKVGRAGMVVHRELQGRILRLVLLATVVLAASSYGHSAAAMADSPNEGQETGGIISVRKVLANPNFGGRYPQTHYYLLYFAVRTSDQTYCAEYYTAVLDEIDDLFSARNRDIEFVLKGKSLRVRTPKGRKLKAHLVGQKQC